MKHYLIGVIAALSLAVQARAIVIDFNNIPSGDPASFTIPGVLEFTAEFGFLPPFEGASVVWADATVRNGYVNATSPFFKFLDEFGDRIEISYFARISARFLQPVSDVNVDLFTSLPGSLGWDFGNTPTPVGGPFDPIFETFNLLAPPGLHVTRFDVSNADEISNLDAGILLDNIHFTLGSEQVPDTGSTAALLATALCGMLLVRRLLIVA